MPELPEIEIVKRSLSKIANKAKITKIKIKNKNLRYKIPNSLSRNLVGKKIQRISRKSKYLIFHFKKEIILAHFGMTGKILILRKDDKKIFKTSFYYDLNILPKHNHIFITLNNGLTLIYNDVRKFGFFLYYRDIKLNKISFLKKLGLEPFSNKFNIQYFKKFINNKKKNIKSLLMDQTFVCGLGNIYVNECLYMSKIHPLRTSKSLSIEEIKILIANIKKILKLAILKGGSSIRDFKNISGKSGNFQQYFSVYGRENKNCSRISCNGKINKTEISNRATFYCGQCQN